MRVTFYSSAGEQLAVDGSAFGLTAIEGLDRGVEVFTEKRLNGVGDVVTGQRMTGRTVTVKFKNRNQALNAARRQTVTRFFRNGLTFSMETDVAGYTVTVSGLYLKAIKIPTGNPYRGFDVTVTLIAESPYIHVGTVTVQPGTVVIDSEVATYLKLTVTATGAVSSPSIKIDGNAHTIALSGYQPTLASGDVVVFDLEAQRATKNGSTITATGLNVGALSGSHTVELAASSGLNNMTLAISYERLVTGV